MATAIVWAKAQEKSCFTRGMLRIIRRDPGYLGVTFAEPPLDLDRFERMGVRVGDLVLTHCMGGDLPLRG